MNTKPFEQYESVVRSYCRHFPKVFTDAKGAVLKDEDGTEYIDFFCGAGAVNYGHNNRYIKQKMIFSSSVSINSRLGTVYISSAWMMPSVAR